MRGYFNVGAWLGILLFAVTSAATAVLCLGKQNGDRGMLPFGILYLFFIALNFTTVYSCTASRGGIFFVSALGITLFLISDLIIVSDKIIGTKIKNSDLWIWTLYPIGQILLLIGA